MKAIVTGAAGFIGSHLTAALLDRGAEVVGIDCFTDYYPRSIKESNLAVNVGRPEFRFIEAALQTADLSALLDGATHVFHLAAQAGVRKSWGQDFRVYTENNVDATQRLLEACVNRPLHRFVYASSSSVYGDNVSMPMREDALPQPVSPYGVTKLAAEQLCYLYFANHRVPTTSVMRAGVVSKSMLFSVSDSRYAVTDLKRQFAPKDVFRTIEPPRAVVPFSGSTPLSVSNRLSRGGQGCPRNEGQLGFAARR